MAGGVEMIQIVMKPTPGAGVQDRVVPDIHRDLTAFFHDTAVRHIAAGGQAARKVNNISDLDVFQIFC